MEEENEMEKGKQKMKLNMKGMQEMTVTEHVHNVHGSNDAVM